MDPSPAKSSLNQRGLGFGGRGSHLVISALVGPLLATLLVLNRVYFRLRLVRTLGADDMLIVASTFFLWGLGVVDIISIDHGYGRPSKTLSSPDLALALQMFWADQILYKFTINLTKLSILAFYLRVFSKHWFRVTCWITAIIVWLYTFISIVVTIFQCRPVSRVWDKSIAGTCIKLTAFWYANAIYNILTDVAIMATVPFVIWVLDLSKQQRIGLIVLFGLVIFTFTTSLLRITTLSPAAKTTDQTFGTLVSTIWTVIEPSMAIVCACLPMLKTPLKMLWPRLFGMSRISRRRRSGRGRGVSEAREDREGEGDVEMFGRGRSDGKIDKKEGEKEKATVYHRWSESGSGSGSASRNGLETPTNFNFSLPISTPIQGRHVQDVEAEGCREEVPLRTAGMVPGGTERGGIREREREARG